MTTLDIETWWLFRNSDNPVCHRFRTDNLLKTYSGSPTCSSQANRFQKFKAVRVNVCDAFDSNSESEIPESGTGVHVKK